ncbi:hypothetical protein LPTSP4_01300 [Leptospira ryugenii]|uniref:Tetratricopeptide repeat protein n=1 Tax=Leptospira ryugenii TaxID=1917863 RepID=A0A2P2DVN8_9LEPT|nr:hypothetical protein [Leptospira ryugenii]GBF48630.1 hypothetical protein LPTSP4_01300 [Leptospira ryugenii]
MPKIYLKAVSISKQHSVDELALRQLLAYEWQSMSGIVYLSEVDASKATLVLDFDLEQDESKISITPKIEYPNEKKSYKGEILSMPWSEYGKMAKRLTYAYLKLIAEKNRLHRYLYSEPVYHPQKEEWDQDILSQSEAMVYRSLASKQMSREEKLSRYAALVSGRPKFLLFRYESLLEVLSGNRSSEKEIWKEWLSLDPKDSIFSYLLAESLADSAKKKGDYELANEFYLQVKKQRETLGHIYSPNYAFAMSELGGFYQRTNQDSALYHLNTAKLIYEAMGMETSLPYIKNQIRYSALLSSIGQKELALNEMFSLETRISLLAEKERALFYYNLARLEYEMQVYESSLQYLKKAKDELKQIAWINTDLHFTIMNLAAASYFSLGKVNKAEEIWLDLVQSKNIFSIETRPFFRKIHYNLARLYVLRGAKDLADTYYKVYTRLTPYSEIRDLSNSERLELETFLFPEMINQNDSSLLTDWEKETIKSYTGRYVFQSQDDEKRARTYQDRLEDSNLLLSDLIDSQKENHPTLLKLKNSLFAKKKSYEKGENILFFDIGPALNNLEAPAITSQSVAYHFPKMDVVLWELPSEVELFHKNVSDEKKEKLYSFSNLRILSANGVAKPETTLEDHKNWVLLNRSIPKWKDKTIILRAANSIDIYETFDAIYPHLLHLAEYFKENPVIYFFNRSILLKKANSSQFMIIGYQSVRGFHHNYQSLDRNGEPPYTLFQYPWEEFE